MKYLAPVPKQYVDESGIPYSGGTVSVYLHGTPELAEIYSGATGEALIENPCTLDSNGSWQCFVPSGVPLDYIVMDADGNVVSSFIDVVIPEGSGGSSSDMEVAGTPNEILVDRRHQKFVVALSSTIKNAISDLADGVTSVLSALGGKADKVTDATSGNFASLDANGNLTDSGKSASDFVAADAGVTNVAWDTTNKKITKTINGSSSEVVAASTLKTAMELNNVTNDAQVKRSEMGVANGVATLDSTGKIPTSQIPSAMGDVKEGYLYNGSFYYDAEHTQEITPAADMVYVDKSTNKTYRWSGTQYVVIGSDLALGETSSTAYRGDRGKAAYDFSQNPYTSNPAMNGTASAGSSTKWAKGDHVHPTDTSREAVSNKKQSVDPTSTTEYGSSKAVADFVNSSVATNTANFIGTISESSLGLDYTATNEQIALALNVHTWVSAPTNNDYCFVSVNDPQTTDVDEYRRFKFNGSVWAYEYTLNNSSFTQAQWNAINSGLTSSDRTTYNAAVTLLNTHVGDSGIHVTSSEKNAWNAKQDTVSTDTDSSDFGDNTSIATGFSSNKLHLNIASRLWTYIQGKISSVLGLTAISYGGKAATADSVTATTATADTARRVWFSDALDPSKRVYNDNFLYNPVTNILTTNISGNAATATTAAGYTNDGAIATALSSKAEKVTPATNGNFAGLDSNGNLTDSGKKASDFATDAQGTKADSALQGVKLAGASSALTPDATKVVTVPNAVPTGTGETNGLMTAADKAKLDAIASGAEVNVQADWGVTDPNSDAFVKGKPYYTMYKYSASTYKVCSFKKLANDAAECLGVEFTYVKGYAGYKGTLLYKNEFKLLLQHCNTLVGSKTITFYSYVNGDKVDLYAQTSGIAVTLHIAPIANIPNSLIDFSDFGTSATDVPEGSVEITPMWVANSRSSSNGAPVKVDDNGNLEACTVDNTPTTGSQNLVTSDGVKAALDTKLDTTGDTSNTTSTFTKDASDTSSMTSGSKLSALFTAISSFFASLKALAFKDAVDTSDIADDAVTAAKVKDNETLPVNVSGTAGIAPRQFPYRTGTTTIGGRTYNTVIIGNQEWLSENLQYNDGGTGIASATSGTFVGQIYYQKTAMTRINAALTDGWHVPSQAEYDMLRNHIGINISGTLLKSTGLWGSSKNGKNYDGFNVLPCGNLNPDASNHNVKWNAYLWTSTSNNDNYFVFWFTTENEGTSTTWITNVDYYNSIRLVRNISSNISDLPAVGSTSTPVYVDASGEVRPCSFSVNFGTPVSGANVLNIVTA